MERRDFLVAGTAVAAMTLVDPAAVFAKTGEKKALPKPDTTRGKPLMTCLAERHTNRDLGHEDVDLQTLAEILWAAFGVNRESGKHVVPTAMDRRRAIVYAVRSDGVWQYLPKEHAILKVLEGDKRELFDNSGLILLYVAPKDDQFSPMHVGSMYQNVGLYCAAVGLANCVKFQKHDALDAALPLQKDWKTFITHSIARPAK